MQNEASDQTLAERFLKKNENTLSILYKKQ